MALVLCPECGEQTLDRLVNCPVCDEQLVDKEARDKTKQSRFIIFGSVFVGGLIAATLCNMMGYTTLAIGLGVVGLLSMATLIVKLNSIS